MRPQVRLTILMVLLAAASGPAPALGNKNEAQEQARELINNMIAATENRNYIGTFVYQRGEHLDSMRIIHRSDANGINERLISLTGYPREVIRDNEDVTCIFPGSRAIIMEKRGSRKYLPTSLPYPIENVAEFYQFQVQGLDRVAGREAIVVSIRPKDTFRFGYRLWIDRESHLLLKSFMTDGQGKAFQQFLFTDLVLPEHIPDTALTPSIQVHGFTLVSNEAKEIPSDDSVKPDLEVKWLPQGFAMRDRGVHPIATSPMPVEQMVFSDGLAMVSIFVERLEPGTERLEGLSRVGAVIAYGQVNGDYQITVVGEVPDDTARRIAESITLGSKS